MQGQTQLSIDPQVGKAVSQIPTGWFKYVNNVLKYLKVRNGRLIIDNDRWTIECGGKVNILGEPREYKPVTLMGWKKLDDEPESQWIQMTIEEMNTVEWPDPRKFRNQFVDGEDNYPWYAIELTYDYIRAVELPEP